MPRPETHARLRYARYLLLAGTALSGVPAVAGDLPTGGSVAHGSATITTPAPKSMAINQTSQRAIVNWQGFSVGQGARVDITQPSASSAILNRVTGSTPSSIAGQLNANGRVYLVNPNGIVIGNGGMVRTGGGFVASTLGIRDDDFMAGRNEFAGNGRSAAITNRGTIEIGSGGFAALLGGKVDNQGTISVPMGRVGIGAGERATLDLSGDGFLQVEVPSEQVPGDDGALINNVGRITADGGRVEIRAATARQAARNAINLSGVVEARSVSGRSGAIILGGGEGGRVTVSGRLDASAPAPISAAAPPPPRPEIGGSVTVTGDIVELAGAAIDVSGAYGGGTVRIGGDFRGLGTLQRASTTTIDAATTIRADATRSGDGGTVIVWSDGNTGFAGNISARGGPEGGDGGFAEVSGKALLSYFGRTDLSAPAGAFGTLLLDPTNVFIEDSATSGMNESGGFFFPDFDAENAVLNVEQLTDALSLANVTVQTTSSAAQDGNITVGTAISWDTDTTLRLDAEGSIILANPIDAPTGSLELFAPDGGVTTPTSWTNSAGVVQTGGNGSVNVAVFDLVDGTDWVQNMASLPDFAADDFLIDGGGFLRVQGGSGTPGAPYIVTDVYGLQGIDTRPDLFGSSFALANDIDASVTSGWTDFEEGVVGFDPIGEFDGEELTPFAGAFDGRGFEIDGLFIDRPGEDYVGLFAALGPTGSVQDVGLTDFDITGGFTVGALAGENAGSIARVYAESPGPGAVVGAQDVGGLVGVNDGSILHTYADADVAQTNDAFFVAGGLVGYNTGTIGQSYAAGDVVGDFDSSLGGLVGQNDGDISDSYALGSVSSGTFCDCGGLVGSNFGSIIRAYATGNVPAGAGQKGGLTGVNETEGAEGTITDSFWDTVTTFQPTNAGGGTGLTTAQFQNMAGFMALAQPQGWNFETTWAPPSPGFYPELYALTPVVRVDVNNATRLYGGTNPALTSTNFGGPSVYVFGPASDSLNTSSVLTTSAAPGSGVGVYSIAASGSSATSAGGQVYRLVTIPGTLTVTPAPLTITADYLQKLFGTTLTFTGTEFTALGLVNGDLVNFVQLSSAGAAAGASVAGSPYAITASNATGTGLISGGVSNYDITYFPGSLEVLPPPPPPLPPSVQLPPTLPWLLPAVTLPNPQDSIIVVAAGGEGAADGGGGAAGGPTLGTGQSTVAAAEETLAAIERVSDDLEQRMRDCEATEPETLDFLACVRDALSQYASGLDPNVLNLPEPLRAVSAIIQQASREIETARATATRRLLTATTDEEIRAIEREALTQARDSVQNAVVEIRKTIQLIRADEPQVASLYVEQGDTIAASMQSVEARLTRVVGL